MYVRMSTHKFKYIKILNSQSASYLGVPTGGL